jgi:hypothetical protein
VLRRSRQTPAELERWTDDMQLSQQGRLLQLRQRRLIGRERYSGIGRQGAVLGRQRQEMFFALASPIDEVVQHQRLRVGADLPDFSAANAAARWPRRASSACTSWRKLVRRFPDDMPWMDVADDAIDLTVGGDRRLDIGCSRSTRSPVE